MGRNTIGGGWSSLRTRRSFSVVASLVPGLQQCRRTYSSKDQAAVLSSINLSFGHSRLGLSGHQPQLTHHHHNTPNPLASQLGQSSSSAATPTFPPPILGASTYTEGAMGGLAATGSPTISLGYLILFLIWSTSGALALVQTLCSSQNTGSAFALGMNLGNRPYAGIGE